MGYQNALITGASSGLGRGLAVWFAKKGVTVYAAARRTAELEKLRDECKDFSGKVVPMSLDVSDGDATYARVVQLDTECGGLDLVVANAGVGSGSSARKVEWSHLSKMLRVNVEGATATIAGALPGMTSRGKGHLVGVSSLAAFNGTPRMGAYCGTKAYLATYLEGLRLDVTHLGLSVTCLHPGFVKTELTAKNTNMPFVLEADDAVQRMAKAIERRDKTFLFPWPLAMAVRTLAALPNPLFEVAARKLR